MTYYVSSGTLNPTHSLTHSSHEMCNAILVFCHVVCRYNNTC